AVPVCYGDGGSAEVFPIGVPVAVYSGYPQSEHVFRVLDAPPGAGPLETLLGDVAMRAFDFARSDRQSLGQRLSIVQLVLAAAQITMASAHRRLFVVDFRRFAMTDERPQCHLETPVSERVLLRLDPGFPRGGVGRDRFGGGAQILANMIEIDQVAALIAKLLLDLAHNPWRAIADRVDPRVRPEAGANRAGQRPAPLGVRQRKLPTRLDDRNHAAVSFHDDRLTEAWTFRKFQIRSTGFEHRLGMGERDPLDRALPNLEAVMLPQLASNLREGLIGGEVDDDALQGARTARGADFRAAQKRAHTLVLEPILRLLDLYLAEFRMPADFFSPWRCI